MITTGMPRRNDQGERVNGTLEAVFSKIAIEEPKKWYKFLRRAQHALNGTFQRSIGTSPYELLFGTKLRTQEDQHIVDMIGECQRNEFQQGREEARDCASEQIKKVQEENRRGYNKKRCDAQKYKVGDIVAIKRTQQGPGLKLAIKFLGPY